MLQHRSIASPGRQIRANHHRLLRVAPSSSSTENHNLNLSGPPSTGPPIHPRGYAAPCSPCFCLFLVRRMGNGARIEIAAEHEYGRDLPRAYSVILIWNRLVRHGVITCIRTTRSSLYLLFFILPALGPRVPRMLHRRAVSVFGAPRPQSTED